MSYNKLLNIAISAVVNDGKVLLIKRVKPPYAGYWAIPGGKVEFGEHPEEAAVREIKEETDLDCQFEELRGMASEIVHAKDDSKIAQFMLYVCKLNRCIQIFKCKKKEKLNGLIWNLWKV